jgi:hypothetical protein
MILTLCLTVDHVSIGLQLKMVYVSQLTYFIGNLKLYMNRAMTKPT